MEFTKTEYQVMLDGLWDSSDVGSQHYIPKGPSRQKFGQPPFKFGCDDKLQRQDFS